MQNKCLEFFFFFTATNRDAFTSIDVQFCACAFVSYKRVCVASNHALPLIAGTKRSRLATTLRLGSGTTA